MIYFTSDLHFGHDKEFVYKKRGFEDVEDMNVELMAKWNSVVYPEDEVYVLGDIMLGDPSNIEYFMYLNGTKHIILGNHDTDRKVELYRSCSDVKDIKYADVVKYGKYKFYLSHYPTMTAPDNSSHITNALINLHGHTHFTDRFYNDMCFCYNVGLDAHDNKPVSVEQIIEDIKRKKETL